MPSSLFPLFLTLLPFTLSHPLTPFTPSSSSSSSLLTPASNLTTPPLPLSSNPPPTYLLDITPTPGGGSIGRTLFTLFASSLLAEIDAVIANPRGRGVETPLDDPFVERRMGVKVGLASVPYLTLPSVNAANVSSSLLSSANATVSAANATTNALATTNAVQTAKHRRKIEERAIDYLDYGLLRFVIGELKARGSAGDWGYGASGLEVSVLEDDGAVDVVARGGVERKLFEGEG